MVTRIIAFGLTTLLIAGCRESAQRQSIREQQRDNVIAELILNLRNSNEIASSYHCVVDGKFELEVAISLVDSRFHRILRDRLDDFVFLNSLSKASLNKDDRMLVAIAKSPWLREEGGIRYVRVYGSDHSSGYIKINRERHEFLVSELVVGKTYDMDSLEEN